MTDVGVPAEQRRLPFVFRAHGGAGRLVLPGLPIGRYLDIERLELELADVSVEEPEDAPAERFQRRRTQLGKLTVRVGPEALALRVEATRRQLAALGISQVSARFGDGFISIRARIADGLAVADLSFRVHVATSGAQLRLLAGSIRVHGHLPLPGPLVADRILSALMAVGEGDRERRPVPRGLGDLEIDLVGGLLWQLLPPRGWRLPKTAGIELAALRMSRAGIEISYAPLGARNDAEIGVGALAIQLATAHDLMHTADEQLREGQIEEAMRGYRSLLASGGPDQPIVLGRILSLAITRSAWFYDGVELARQALARWPHYAPAHAALAGILLAQGDAREAANHLHALARLASGEGDDDEATLAALAGARLLRVLDPRASTALYQLALEHDPGSVESAEALADRLTDEARWPELVRLLRARAVTASPERAVQLRLRLAEVLARELADEAAAAAEVAAARALAPDDPAVHEMAAGLREAAGDVGGALDAWHTVIELAQRRGEAADRRTEARAWARIGSLSLADAQAQAEDGDAPIGALSPEASWRRALELYPAEPEALGGLGRAHRERGEHASAIALYERVRGAGLPLHISAHFELEMARCLIDVGREDDARAALRRAAVGRTETAAEAHALLADISSSSDPHHAAAELDTAIASLVDLAEGAFAVEGHRLFRRAAQLAVSRADLLERQGDETAATADLQRAHFLAANHDAHVARQAARALLGRAGDDAAAERRWLDAVLATEPDAADKARLLMQSALARRRQSPPDAGSALAEVREASRLSVEPELRRHAFELEAELLSDLGNQRARATALSSLAELTTSPGERMASEVAAAAAWLAADDAAAALPHAAAAAAIGDQPEINVAPALRRHVLSTFGEAAWRQRAWADVVRAYSELVGDTPPGSTERVGYLLRIAVASDKRGEAAVAKQSVLAILDGDRPASPSAVLAELRGSALRLLADMADKSGDGPGSAASLEKLAAANAGEATPLSRAEALYRAGELYRRASRLEDAVRCLEAALRIADSHLPALDALELAWRERGDLERVAVVLGRKVAATRQPARQKPLLVRLGDLQAQLGRPDVARATHRRALDIDASWRPSLRFLAQADARQGQLAAAARTYVQLAGALDSDPSIAGEEVERDRRAAALALIDLLPALEAAEDIAAAITAIAQHRELPEVAAALREIEGGGEDPGAPASARARAEADDERDGDEERDERGDDDAAEDEATGERASTASDAGAGEVTQAGPIRRRVRTASPTGRARARAAGSSSTIPAPPSLPRREEPTATHRGTDHRATAEQFRASARLARQRGDLPAALAAFETAQHLSPHDPALLAELIDVARAQGDLPATARHLRSLARLLPAGPRRADALIELADLCYDHLDDAKAARLAMLDAAAALGATARGEATLRMVANESATNLAWHTAVTALERIASERRNAADVLSLATALCRAGRDAAALEMATAAKARMGAAGEDLVAQLVIGQATKQGLAEELELKAETLSAEEARPLLAEAEALYRDAVGDDQAAARVRATLAALQAAGDDEHRGEVDDEGARAAPEVRALGDDARDASNRATSEEARPDAPAPAAQERQVEVGASDGDADAGDDEEDDGLDAPTLDARTGASLGPPSELGDSPRDYPDSQNFQFGAGSDAGIDDDEDEDLDADALDDFESGAEFETGDETLARRAPEGLRDPEPDSAAPSPQGELFAEPLSAAILRPPADLDDLDRTSDADATAARRSPDDIDDEDALNDVLDPELVGVASASETALIDEEEVTGDTELEDETGEAPAAERPTDVRRAVPVPLAADGDVTGRISTAGLVTADLLTNFDDEEEVTGRLASTELLLADLNAAAATAEQRESLASAERGEDPPAGEPAQSEEELRFEAKSTDRLPSTGVPSSGVVDPLDDQLTSRLPAIPGAAALSAARPPRPGAPAAWSVMARAGMRTDDDLDERPRHSSLEDSGDDAPAGERGVDLLAATVELAGRGRARTITSALAAVTRDHAPAVPRGKAAPLRRRAAAETRREAASLFRLANAELARAKLDAATTLLARAHDLDPGYAPVFLPLADRLAATGDLAGAHRLLLEASAAGELPEPRRRWARARAETLGARLPPEIRAAQRARAEEHAAAAAKAAAAALVAETEKAALSAATASASAAAQATALAAALSETTAERASSGSRTPLATAPTPAGAPAAEAAPSAGSAAPRRVDSDIVTSVYDTSRAATVPGDASTFESTRAATVPGDAYYAGRAALATEDDGEDYASVAILENAHTRSTELRVPTVIPTIPHPPSPTSERATRRFAAPSLDELADLDLEGSLAEPPRGPWNENDERRTVPLTTARPGTDSDPEVLTEATSLSAVYELVAAGNLPAAITLAEKAATEAETASASLSGAGRDLTALELLEELYLESGDGNAAAETIGRQIALTDEAPALAQLWRRRARTYRELGREQQAYRCLKEAHAADPQHPDHGYELRCAAMARREWNLAVSLLLREIDNAPDDRERAALHFEIGLIYDERLDEGDQAVHHYERALDLDPTIPAVDPPLARRYEAQGRHREAAIHFQRAINRGLIAAATESTTPSASPTREPIALIAPSPAGSDPPAPSAFSAAFASLPEAAREPAEPAAAAVSPASLLTSLPPIPSGDAVPVPPHRRAPTADGAPADLSDFPKLSASFDAVEPHIDDIPPEDPPPSAPPDIPALEDALEQAKSGGDRSEILAAGRRLWQLSPGNAVAFAALANEHTANGDLESLIELTAVRAAMTAESAGRASLWIDVARLAEELGEEPQAARAYDLALIEDPSSPIALDARAGLAFRLGDFATAEMIYRDIDPPDSILPVDELMLRRSVIAEHSSRGAEALTYAQEAAAAAPGRIELQRRVQELATRAGDLATALPAARAVMALVPIDQEEELLASHFALVGLLHAIGDHAGAIANLERLRREHPGSRDVIAALASVHADRGDWAAACQYLYMLVPLAASVRERALRLFELGEVFLTKVGDLERADDAFLRASDLDPGCVPALRRLIDSYWRADQLGPVLDISSDLAGRGALFEPEMDPSSLGRAAIAAAIAEDIPLATQILAALGADAAGSVAAAMIELVGRDQKLTIANACRALRTLHDRGVIDMHAIVAGAEHPEVRLAVQQAAPPPPIN